MKGCIDATSKSAGTEKSPGRMATGAIEKPFKVEGDIRHSFLTRPINSTISQQRFRCREDSKAIVSIVPHFSEENENKEMEMILRQVVNLSTAISIRFIGRFRIDKITQL
jgi:hypothetical protein